MKTCITKLIESGHHTMGTDQYFLISFFGIDRAYSKYCALETATRRGIAWLRGRGLRDEADALEHWATMPGGFTCQHTPYHVQLSEREWKLLSNALRQGMGGSTAAYDSALNYGAWIAGGMVIGKRWIG